MERFATAVRSSTLARLVTGDRAVTVCERSLGCMGILTWETGYALPAARAKNPAWLKCMTAQRCVSLLKAGGRVPLAFPLRCYAWIVGSLVRFLCVGYCLAQVVLLVPVSVGPVCPSVHCWSAALPAGVLSRIAADL